MKSEERFKQLLRELFQSERADLDFGIYRVMNQKREALEDFIENGIVGEVKKALQNATTGAAGKADMSEDDRQKVLDWLKLSIGDNFDDKGELKPNATGTPVAKAWQILQGDSFYMPPPDEEMRKDVYNNLHTFFARYYDDGDFMCKQRYSANGRYAVPYNGEETLLHWANKDQYYIKTAEYFLRYEFKLPNGKPARFEVRKAELERDNNKGDKKKYFIPLTKEFSADKNGCVLPFEYRPLTDAEKKKYGNGNGNGANKTVAAIAAAAVEALTGNAAAAPLLQKAEGGETLLSLQMQKYVKLNTADFFIHKNLGKFLREELDYYINKELLVAEEQLRNNANSRARAAVAQATKAAGEVVIDFLAQLENYQKAIWEKKKFVVDTNYIITLQEIADKTLRDIIAKNDAQWREWKELNFIPADIPAKGKARLDFMESNPTLPVDTKHFDAEFKRQWLATVDGLDDKTDGVLFHGENWQALNLLQGKYRGKVKCIYIDPPYNTDNDGFLYKDSYQHSSWLSMIYDRVLLGKEFATKDGALFTSIDEVEQPSYRKVLDDTWGAENFIADMVWSAGRKNNSQLVSLSHEYVIIYASDRQYLSDGGVTWRQIKKGLDEIYAQHNNLKRKHKNDYAMMTRALKEWFRGLPDAHPSKAHRQYSCVDARGVYFPADISSPGGGGAKYEVLHPITGKPVRVPSRGWITGDEERMRQWIADDLVHFGDDENSVPCAKLYLKESEYQVPYSVFYQDGRGATKRLRHVLGDDDFGYPKDENIIAEYAEMLTASDDCVLDYFAGSGTTAHAVINLNRKDGDKRKFILVEMGEHFKTVIVPRVKKIIFTPEWRDGKPARAATPEETKRAPRIVKYHRLESYEDALENIRFDETVSKPALLYDDYAPRYMLQAESKKSATFAGDCEKFQKPFNYTLQKYNAGKKLAVADLPETFAYLIGLQEKTRQFVANGKIEYVIQRGTAEGKETAVLWRNTENWKEADYQKEVAFVEKQGLTANAEQIFANDESRIKGAASLTPIFAAQMFGENDGDYI